MTKIGIVRHGVTHWNIEGRAQGSSDIPLNEEGLMQAERVAERLSKEEWDIVYTSDLTRAHQTAKAIAEKMDIPLRLDSRLRELGGGLIEGTTEAERVSKWGTDWRELDLKMETEASVIERGKTFIDEITGKHTGERILIVSHGAFLKRLINVVVPHFTIEESLKNTSFTSLVMADRQWDCDLYNCTAHLVRS
ncbi:histidine phosphatase family protein [Oceanobacillus damuensis]|uniref:histidine phosphatase family protein n=1 Tax=Oceanobacillus damuensis TaxID=937928 RepID=UPI000834FEFC|nr:histidine phosphatase family protein [Oceanobacillus damuensis]